jgi:hypothetical protein
MATTKLDGALKRELAIAGEPYTLTVSPAGMTLVRKGRRKGLELAWSDLVNGDAALATALNASLTADFTRPGEPAPDPGAGAGHPAAWPAGSRAGRAKR